MLLRAGPPSQLAIIAAAVPATQALSHAGGTRPAGRADRLRVGLSAVTLCQIGQCLSVCPGESEPPPSHYCLPHSLQSDSLGFPRPAGPRPETRTAGYKPKGVIQRLSGGSESAALRLASPVKFSVRPSNSVIGRRHRDHASVCQAVGRIRVRPDSDLSNVRRRQIIGLNCRD